MKAHIERRHKNETKDAGASTIPDGLKKTQGFESQKRQSNKLGGGLTKKKLTEESSMLSFSTTEQLGTPVPLKNKVPA